MIVPAPLTVAVVDSEKRALTTILPVETYCAKAHPPDEVTEPVIDVAPISVWVPEGVAEPVPNGNTLNVTECPGPGVVTNVTQCQLRY